MRLRISDAAAAPDLVAFLRERVDCIVEQTAWDTIEVSILGSRTGPHNWLELETRLRPWRAANPDVHVTLERLGLSNGGRRR